MWRRTTSLEKKWDPRNLLIYFSLTLFASAALLFLVQPMIGKMILPHLGGTPAVWNTCMVFFQGVLLVGYGYTHVLTTTQSVRRQVLIQGAMLFLPFLVLPFALGAWEPPSDANPVFSLLGKLVVMVGLPFFAVSTTAPLLQKWFAHTGHRAAADPYFLYGASNLGSMVGLALYPTVIEPWLPVVPGDGEKTLESQVHLWTAGFAIFVVLVIGCALAVWKGASDSAVAGLAKAAVPVDDPGAREVTIGRRIRWVGLAAVPSSLMLGVTTYMTTDIAAIAFFWILPLALYLLTFILVFARWPVVWTGMPHRVVLWLQPVFLLVLVFRTISGAALPAWAEFMIHLAAFFTSALVCHGELARDRPSTKHLTEFYFWMSLGGVLGGLFNALFAPIVFQHGIWEYPIATVAACLLRPNLVTRALLPDDSSPGFPTRWGHLLDGTLPILLGGSAVSLIGVSRLAPDMSFLLGRSFLLAIPAMLTLLLLWRPLRFGLTVAALLIAVGADHRVREPIIYEGRGFFGLVRVRSAPETVVQPRLPGQEPTAPERKTFRILISGGINHGGQIVAWADEHGHEDAARSLQLRRMPITYFHERNGVAEVYHKLSWPHAQPGDMVGKMIGLSDARLPASMFGLASGPFAAHAMLVNTQSEPPVAVVGLGSGILACYAKPFQTMDFYEIDPLVKDLTIAPGYVPPWHARRQHMPANLPAPAFSFLHDAQERWAKTDVILGDGRLKLRDAPANYYHVISLDAFSSDAIPIHLLTAEAIELYMSKLADGGVLIFNATNAYVRVQGVLSAIAREKGYECLHCSDRRHATDAFERLSADWVVLQRKTTTPFRNGGPSIHDRLEKERKQLAWNGQPVLDAEGKEIIETRWRPVDPFRGPIWTDRYSNLLDPQVMPWLNFWGR